MIEYITAIVKLTYFFFETQIVGVISGSILGFLFSLIIYKVNRSDTIFDNKKQLDDQRNIHLMELYVEFVRSLHVFGSCIDQPEGFDNASIEIKHSLRMRLNDGHAAISSSIASLQIIDGDSVRNLYLGELINLVGRVNRLFLMQPHPARAGKIEDRLRKIDTVLEKIYTSLKTEYSHVSQFKITPKLSVDPKSED